MTNQQHSNKQKEKKIIYMAKTNIYMQKQNKTSKKTDRMFVHTPKLK
jgi:hypothetical protein